jgi:ring-1,2-phenylacetyl-CoA epoxidase subunit PaaC
MSAPPVDYLLHLADNALVLGQRNAEWCGHGPVLEEDIAMANISLDLIGQARLLYQRGRQLMGGDGATEDKLAYFRDAPEFRNYTLLELPARTARWWVTPCRPRLRHHHRAQLPLQRLMVLVWERLQSPADAQPGRHRRQVAQGSALPPAPRARLAGALGDGTDESHRPHAGRFGPPDALHAGVLDHSPMEQAAADAVSACDGRSLRRWERLVNERWPKPR